MNANSLLEAPSFRVGRPQFIAGFTLFAVCMIVLYGHTQYWYHLSYEESMLIPVGCFVSSALFVASVLDILSG